MIRIFKTKNKKHWFSKKNKSDKRNNLVNKPNQKVISYYTASRRQLDNFDRISNSSSDDVLGKRRLNNLRRFWFGLIVLISIIVVLCYLGTLSITPHISISGTAYRPIAEYQSIVSRQFSLDLRNRFKPLMDSKQIESNVLKSIPEAQSVDVKSSLLGHRAEVNLVIPKPVAVFSQSNKNNLILSERGRLLLAESQSSTDNTSLPTLKNSTGISGEAGEQYMRPDEAKALVELVKQYKTNGLNNVEYSLTNIPHELQAKEAGRGYYVRYLLDNTITKQYGALQATQKELQKIGQNPSEYIDVRLVEKVYYK